MSSSPSAISYDNRNEFELEEAISSTLPESRCNLVCFISFRLRYFSMSASICNILFYSTISSSVKIGRLLRSCSLFGLWLPARLSSTLSLYNVIVNFYYFSLAFMRVSLGSILADLDFGGFGCISFSLACCTDLLLLLFFYELFKFDFFWKDL